jgi:hypothetical protein
MNSCVLYTIIAMKCLSLLNDSLRWVLSDRCSLRISHPTIEHDSETARIFVQLGSVAGIALYRKGL